MNPVEVIERKPTEEGGIAQEATAASMAGLGEEEADSRAVREEGENSWPGKLPGVLAQLWEVRLGLRAVWNDVGTASFKNGGNGGRQRERRRKQLGFRPGTHIGRLPRTYSEHGRRGR